MRISVLELGTPLPQTAGQLRLELEGPPRRGRVDGRQGRPQRRVGHRRDAAQLPADRDEEIRVGQRVIRQARGELPILLLRRRRRAGAARVARLVALPRLRQPGARRGGDRTQALGLRERLELRYTAGGLLHRRQQPEW